MKTISIILFILLAEAFLFLNCAQNTENGFKIIKESHDRMYYEDINIEKYKSYPKDSLGNNLNLYGIKFNSRDKLTCLEKSIFNPEERGQIQRYGRRTALALFTIEATSGNIVGVSFVFRNIDDSFSVNSEKLAKYRDKIKGNIKYNSLSFEGGEEVISGYFQQILPVFID